MEKCGGRRERTKEKREGGEEQENDMEKGSKENERRN